MTIETFYEIFYFHDENPKLCQETRCTSVLFLMCSVRTARQDQESYYPMRNHRPTWVMLPSRAIEVFTFVLM